MNPRHQFGLESNLIDRTPFLVLAHHPRAAYIRAERGSQTPRDLTGAFFKAVTGDDWLETSVEKLETLVDDLKAAYDLPDLDFRRMQVGRTGEEGYVTLKEIAAFAAASAPGSAPSSAPAA